MSRSYVTNWSPKELLITPTRAFTTGDVIGLMDLYETSYPTNPNVGRIWHDGRNNRICWTEHDFRDNSILIHKVPYELTDLNGINFLRRRAGLDESTVIVNANVEDIVDDPKRPLDGEPKQILVSISITIPNTGLTSVLDLVRPVIDMAAQVKSASTTISIQPFSPESDA